jgi:hypothetical protein
MLRARYFRCTVEQVSCRKGVPINNGMSKGDRVTKTFLGEAFSSDDLSQGGFAIVTAGKLTYHRCRGFREADSFLDRDWAYAIHGTIRPSGLDMVGAMGLRASLPLPPVRLPAEGGLRLAGLDDGVEESHRTL